MRPFFRQKMQALTNGTRLQGWSKTQDTDTRIIYDPKVKRGKEGEERITKNNHPYQHCYHTAHRKIIIEQEG